jgi:hypothetical protein
VACSISVGELHRGRVRVEAPSPGGAAGSDLCEQFLGTLLGQASAVGQGSGSGFGKQFVDPCSHVQGCLGTTAAQCVRADEDGHWPTMAGDRDFLTMLYSGEQLWQRSPSLGSSDGGHDELTVR